MEGFFNKCDYLICSTFLKHFLLYSIVYAEQELIASLSKMLKSWNTDICKERFTLNAFDTMKDVWFKNRKLNNKVFVSR